MGSSKNILFKGLESACISVIRICLFGRGILKLLIFQFIPVQSLDIDDCEKPTQQTEDVTDKQENHPEKDPEQEPEENPEKKPEETGNIEHHETQEWLQDKPIYYYIILFICVYV